MGPKVGSKVKYKKDTAIVLNMPLGAPPFINLLFIYPVQYRGL